jgi:hypothetical protein
MTVVPDRRALSKLPNHKLPNHNAIATIAVATTNTTTTGPWTIIYFYTLTLILLYSKPFSFFF